MSKKMDVVHMIRKKKHMKRTRKKKNQHFKKVLDYLKSDYFLFAPFDSSSSQSLPFVSTGVKGIETTKQNDKKWLQKIGDYLKLDSYLYGPLVTSQPLDLAATPAPAVNLSTVDGGSERAGEPGWKTVNVITKGQLTDSVPHATSTVVTRTHVRREMVKRMIYQNC